MILSTRTNEGMGWRPDLPDYRDERFLFSRALADEMLAPTVLPPSAQPQRRELNKHPPRDQGNAGSCVGHGVGLIAAVERNVTQRSPLFIYAEARKVIGELEQDNGAFIRDGVKVVATLGAPKERDWPYDLSKLHDDPSDKADRDAAKRKVFSYHRLQTGQEFRSCLASGHLFAIGFTVYSLMWEPLVTEHGIVNMPYGTAQGGHCVAVIGYDNVFRQSEWAFEARQRGIPDASIPEQVYECQNSWSASWGRQGRFVIDARYLEHWALAGDAWTLRGFEDEWR